MMGRLNQDQGQLFYSFCLADAVPDDHPVREIAAVLNLKWVYAELAPHYPRMGRPSVDPVLMLRMLLIGYLFAIRSERALCREVKVNLAYRWFCGLSIEDKFRIIQRSVAPAMNGSATATCSARSSSGWLKIALRRGWSAVKALPSMPA